MIMFDSCSHARSAAASAPLAATAPLAAAPGAHAATAATVAVTPTAAVAVGSGAGPRPVVSDKPPSRVVTITELLARQHQRAFSSNPPEPKRFKAAEAEDPDDGEARFSLSDGLFVCRHNEVVVQRRGEREREGERGGEGRREKGEK